MAAKLRVVPIEEGMPSVEEARKTVMVELQKARRDGVRVIKLVHGYGSTGTGGALRHALRKSLLLRKKEGLVAKIIWGEKWSIFEPDTRSLLEQYPELKGDSDLDRGNQGITLALLG